MSANKPSISWPLCLLSLGHIPAHSEPEFPNDNKRMRQSVLIDGSQGEGGGQILRTSLAFSAITGKPVIIENIRANRSKPGLARQHLTGLNLIGQICDAKVIGAELGSTRIEFQPSKIKHGQYSIDIGTAGSITLVLQTILPALATVEGQSTIQLSGGTDVKWSPPADYYKLILFPLLAKLGLKCQLDIKQRGYFPRGGGRVVASITSKGKLKPIKLKSFSGPTDIIGIVNISGLSIKIAERVGSTVLDYFPEATIHMHSKKNFSSQGMGIVLAATDGRNILGASALGERGKSAENVGNDASKNLLAEIEGNGNVDIFASDQLLPYLAIAGGNISAREFTEHAKTNIQTIEKFLGKTFTVSEGEVITILHSE